MKKLSVLKPGCHNLLMECHERLIMNQPPASMHYSRYVKQLMKDGLVTLERYNANGRDLQGFVITKKGIQHLAAAEPAKHRE